MLRLALALIVAVIAVPAAAQDAPKARLGVVVDCPTELIIRPRAADDCTLNITSFSPDLPIEVQVPSMTDHFGNTASGVQLSDLAGRERPQAASPHVWRFRVYACPEDPREESDCTTVARAFEKAAIRVVVHQDGLEDANATLTFDLKPGTNHNRDHTLYGSVFKPGDFLNMRDGKLQVSGVILSWNEARWLVELNEARDGLLIANSEHFEDYLNMAEGTLVAGPADPAAATSHWSLRRASDDSVQPFRLYNKAYPDLYLTVAADGSLSMLPLDDTTTAQQFFILY